MKPLIITTGKGLGKTSEGQILKDLLLIHGIPEKFILIEEESKNTGQNISFAYEKILKIFKSKSITLDYQLIKKLKNNKKHNVAMIQYSSMMYRHFNLDEGVNDWKSSDIGKTSGWNFFPFPSEDSIINDLNFADQVGFVARLGLELFLREQNTTYTMPTYISTMIGFFRQFFEVYQNASVSGIFDLINENIKIINSSILALKSA